MYKQKRRAQPLHPKSSRTEGKADKTVAPATVNRELATLRRLLRLAQEWKTIDRLPRIRLLRGERARTYVLARNLEEAYFAALAAPAARVAPLLLDTGMRVGEALSLDWQDVHLELIGPARYGYLTVRAENRGAPRALDGAGAAVA